MDNKHFKVYSFDIFDTLFTRPYARPVDLFCDVAKRLISEQKLSGSVCPQAFMRARMKAEHQARQLVTDKDDITIDHIYDQFPELAHWCVSKEIALDTELELELAAVIPIRENVEWVQTLQQQGHRVIFISDMYLPTHWLQKMLAKAGVEAQLSEMYVSGEIGLLKHTGRLFKYVLQKEQIKPAQMHHLGDNPSADVAQAKKQGIVVTHYKKSQLNRYEAWESDNSAYNHDRSKFAGISRASRLQAVSGDYSISCLASGVVAPLLTGFVAYVLDDAVKKGITDLCFLSRDGQIFYKIAQELLKDRPNYQVNCHYIYGSRKSWMLPLILDISVDDLSLWIAPKGMDCRFVDIVRRLDLLPDEANLLALNIDLPSNKFDHSLDDTWIAKISEEIKGGQFSQVFRGKCIEKQKHLLAYLSQNGFREGANVALVDIGWALTMQYLVHKLLSLYKVNIKLAGYYLGVGYHHRPLVETGNVYSYISPELNDIRAPLSATWFFKESLALLLEHVFTPADHPSVRTYCKLSDSSIEPLFKENSVNDQFGMFVQNMHDEIIGYAALLKEHSEIDMLSDLFRNYGLHNAKLYITKPDKHNVNTVAWISVNKEATHDSKYEARLASSINLIDITKMVIHVLRQPKVVFFSKHYTWLEGTEALSAWYIRFLMRFLRGSLQTLQKMSKTAKLMINIVKR